jgi:hypothetical protein
MSIQPRVTAVMVTGHDPQRRALASHTARHFDQQSYTLAELLIINQGSKSLLCEPLPRVREVMDGAGLVVGALRNLAWKYAPSELMTCWDDDDVHDPDRISVQVAKFFDKPVVLQNELILHLGTGEHFTFYRKSGYENSLLWPSSTLSRYPELPKSSDSAFYKLLLREFGGITKIDNPAKLYVRLYHGRNIWDEKHFMKKRHRKAADRANNQFRVKPLSAEEQCYIQQLLPIYRQLIPINRQE